MGFPVIFVLLSLCAALTTQSSVPRLDKVQLDVGYHALVKENERKVEVTPRIRVVDAEACAFVVTNKHHGEVPFAVQIKDRESGEAELIAKKDLDCEKRRNYKFDIAAVSCDNVMSNNVTVHLTVVDVNEHPPVFLEESYLVTVDEDKLYDKILQVEAEDDDCTPTYSDICKYEILETNQPFAIDSDGRIKNTEALSWNRSRNHILSVVAYDCGMKRSKPVTVNIKVNRVCKLGWKEIRERVEYTPGSGQRTLFPRARLEMCDVPCDVEKLVTKISLTTRHIGKGCDRDTYSVESQRKLCGASSDSVDLLPSPGIGTEWTRGLPTDEGHESDQIYEFDGATNAVVIPETTLSHNLTDNFTVAFWMKHEPLPDQTNGSVHTKEHVICNADDHKMNRHHYAVFVRNCRLILLLRREFYQERPSVFRPAEWRWKLAEVCDNQWHHYAVSVSFPEATLYVDGQPFKIQTSNPEIIDDWPLHAARGINTTFVVGACWQGKDNKMSFHFRGFLAGLSILRGRTESPEVLACLHRCKEGLEVPPAELLEPGMELLTNSDSSEVTVEGNSKSLLEELVSHVAYMNSREFPTPGRRNLKISTSVSCLNGKVVKVPALEAYVMVEQPEQPSITINGTPNLAREYEAFKQGVDLFASVSVLVSQDSDEDEDDDDDDDDNDETNLQDMNNLETSSGGTRSPIPSGKEHKLDSCTVQVYPPLNPDHEYFKLPKNLMMNLGIHQKESKDGLLIYGADTIHNYELILRQILYFNRKPAYYLNRAFKLVCSELNGRFVSNEYIQTLTVIHPRAEPSQDTKMKQTETAVPPVSAMAPESVASNVALARVDGHEVEFKDAKVKSSNSYMDSNMASSVEAISKTSASHAVTIIIVVCVGFLVFMIVLGVIRIRAAHHRAQETRDEDQEMAWDDSSLTITVNPMDQIEQEQESRQRNEDDDDSDSSDEGSSYHDEMESSEEEQEKVKGRELEWDDSTLTF